MGVKKNFVVKHGLEVNEDLLLVDVDSQRVGIGTTTPDYELDVIGGIGASTVNAKTITVRDELILEGLLRTGSSVGQTGQYLISTGIGVTWQNLPNTRLITTRTAENGQSLFEVNYTIGLLDVFVNGVRLSDSEFTAIDGQRVILRDSCYQGDTVDFIRYSSYTVGGGEVDPSWMKIFEDDPNDNDEFLKERIYTFNNVGIGTNVNLDAKLNVVGEVDIEGEVNVSSIIRASSFRVLTGVPNQFLKADGSVDTNDYLTTTGNGINLTGIVTSIKSGDGIFIDQNTGEVTINSSWISNSTGIHTFASVGIGTTSPTENLTVIGDARITGILTIGSSSITLNGITDTIVANEIIINRMRSSTKYSFPAPLDYGNFTFNSTDAFGISLDGFFDCLKDPGGFLDTIDLGTL